MEEEAQNLCENAEQGKALAQGVGDGYPSLGGFSGMRVWFPRSTKRAWHRRLDKVCCPVLPGLQRPLALV